MEQSIFQRTELLLGTEAMERIAQKRVIIFGIGGVGSWCAESLVRSGVRRLTIVDNDTVAESNINRQLMATTANIGQSKVEAMRERLLSINPLAEVTALHKTYCEATAGEFDLGEFDYVIDAIDSLKDKTLLILRACSTDGVQLFSSMGAALKLDPSRIRVTEFWRVQGDPLARAIRKRFKHDGIFPAHKFQCVYSDERLENQTEREDRGNGTIMHITAIFGLTLASLVIRDSLHQV